jgi:hypothetical protein
MNSFFENTSKTILVYIAKETTSDPYEKNVSISYLNPLPIKALISTISAEKAVWKFYGIKTSEAKELTVKTKDVQVIKMAHKILIESIEYYAYKDNITNFTIEQLDDTYSRINIWRVA